MQSLLIIARSKNCHAKNVYEKDDHGERCHRFGPFLQASPIPTHQDYVAQPTEEFLSGKFGGPPPGGEKSQPT
jgi:hypothetical protein